MVGVTCRLGGLPTTETALLDTGAEWSVVGGDLAASLLPHATSLGVPLTIGTRFGRLAGEFHSLSVELLADAGSPVCLDARVLFAPDWMGPPVLGYRGLLEFLRIALDPGVIGDEWIYFGVPDSAGAPHSALL